MKQTFNTSVGLIEVIVDQESRVVSIYLFDAQHRPVAAAIENWDHVDLVDVLSRQTGVPLSEASRIATALWGQHARSGSLGERLDERRRVESGWSMLENAGIPLRFVAVLLDAVIVFIPLAIVVGLMNGDGYATRQNGYANAGIDFSGRTFWLIGLLGIGYYIACEAAAGATLGKRMVGIRVVSEDGGNVTVRAAVVRNLVRMIDALFFYFIGGLAALLSKRGQRLGDRAAHTLVIRR
jgi:uncharacterized RDD family membrane protein YckC